METIAKVFHELYSDSLEVNRTRDQNESMLERSKLHKNSSFTSRIHNNFNLEQFIVTSAIVSMGLSSQFSAPVAAAVFAFARKP